MSAGAAVGEGLPGWVPWTAFLALIVAGLLVLVLTDPRRKEEQVGTHHWPGAEDEDPDRDAASLAAVTGLGPEREPGEQAQADAARLDPGEWPDLRGIRDVDPDTPHPWRDQ